MSKKDELFPLPEAILKGPWKIERSHGEASVEIAGPVIRVPLGDDPHDQVVRSHEMAHIAYSPRDPKEIPPEIDEMILAAVEDARVNSRARAAGVNLSRGYDPGLVGAVLEKVKKGNGRHLALLAIACIGLPNFGHVMREIAALPNWKTKERIRQAIGPVFEEFDSPRRANFDTTIMLAKNLQNFFVSCDLEDEAEKAAAAAAAARGKKEAEDRAHRARVRKSLGTDGEEESWDRAPHTTRAIVEYRESSFPHLRDWDTDKFHPWGRMSIEEPPRPLRLPGTMGRVRRPYDTGEAIHYPHRALTDMKVFGRKLRHAGGAVLIDGSGSMSLTSAQVLAILLAAPGATVAVYAGLEDGNHDTGILRVLAKGGLRVEDKWASSPGGLNLIDFPALLWLAQQGKPRIWVSDGGVTGIGDICSKGNWLMCAKAMRRFDILRLPKVDEAIDYLQKIALRRRVA